MRSTVSSSFPSKTAIRPSGSRTAPLSFFLRLKTLLANWLNDATHFQMSDQHKGIVRGHEIVTNVTIARFIYKRTANSIILTHLI